MEERKTVQMYNLLHVKRLNKLIAIFIEPNAPVALVIHLKTNLYSCFMFPWQLHLTMQYPWRQSKRTDYNEKKYKRNIIHQHITRFYKLLSVLYRSTIPWITGLWIKGHSSYQPTSSRSLLLETYMFLKLYSAQYLKLAKAL